MSVRLVVLLALTFLLMPIPGASAAASSSVAIGTHTRDTGCESVGVWTFSYDALTRWGEFAGSSQCAAIFVPGMICTVWDDEHRFTCAAIFNGNTDLVSVNTRTGYLSYTYKEQGVITDRVVGSILATGAA